MFGKPLYKITKMAKVAFHLKPFLCSAFVWTGNDGFEISIWVSLILGTSVPTQVTTSRCNPETALIHWIPTQLVKGSHHSLKWMVSQNAEFPNTAVTCVHLDVSGKTVYHQVARLW